MIFLKCVCVCAYLHVEHELVTQELTRLNTDDAAVSEVCFAGQGSLRAWCWLHTVLVRKGTGRAPSLSCWLQDQDLHSISSRINIACQSVTQIVLRLYNSLLMNTDSPPSSVSMLLTFRLVVKLGLLLRSAQPPPASQLKKQVLLLGNFNGRVGRDFEVWKEVLWDTLFKILKQAGFFNQL